MWYVVRQIVALNLQVCDKQACFGRDMCFNVLAEMLLSYTLTLYIKTHDQKTSLTYGCISTMHGAWQSARRTTCTCPKPDWHDLTMPIYNDGVQGR